VLTEADTVTPLCICLFWVYIVEQLLFIELSERGVKHFCTCRSLSRAEFFPNKCNETVIFATKSINCHCACRCSACDLSNCEHTRLVTSHSCRKSIVVCNYEWSRERCEFVGQFLHLQCRDVPVPVCVQRAVRGLFWQFGGERVIKLPHNLQFNSTHMHHTPAYQPHFISGQHGSALLGESSGKRILHLVQSFEQ